MVFENACRETKCRRQRSGYRERYVSRIEPAPRAVRIANSMQHIEKGIHTNPTRRVSGRFHVRPAWSLKPSAWWGVLAVLTRFVSGLCALPSIPVTGVHCYSLGSERFCRSTTAHGPHESPTSDELPTAQGDGGYGFAASARAGGRGWGWGTV